MASFERCGPTAPRCGGCGSGGRSSWAPTWISSRTSFPDGTPDGSYADRQIEGLYQSSLHYDRSARRWLIAGETALLGAAAMFVWEMTRKTHKPDNIPFEPEVRSLRDATGVGIRVAW